MIIDRLCELYDSLESDKLPPPGFDFRDVKYAILIDRSGHPLDIVPLGEEKKKRLNMTVPVRDRTSGNVPIPFCDKMDYLLGVDKKKEIPRRYNAARDIHRDLLENVESYRARAIHNFFQIYEPSRFREFFPGADTDDMTGEFLTFKIKGDTYCAPVYEDIENIWRQRYGDYIEYGKTMECMITGDMVPIPKTHNKVIKTQKAKSALVSFNMETFEHMDKKQGENASLGIEAVEKYSKALAYLQSERKNCKTLGDIKIFVWSNSPAVKSCMEKDGSRKNDLLDALERVAQGEQIEEIGDDENLFILGIQNEARPQIKFWYDENPNEILQGIIQHHKDLEIVEGRKINLETILYSCMPKKGKEKDVSPGFKKDLLKAIFEGTPYPPSLLNIMTNRFSKEEEQENVRAAIIKACLNRMIRFGLYSERRSFTVELDRENTNQGYLLGRLIAVLGCAQEKAVGKDYIRSGSYPGAKSHPINAFPRLLNNYNNHIDSLRKQEPGYAKYYEGFVEEIMEKLHSFPVNITQVSQGAFDLGYYHQRKEMFSIKKETEKKEDE